MDRVRGSVAGATVAVAMVLGAVAGVPAASASPTSGPTTAVSIGDSYISGEAGRWAGNSISTAPGEDGTDRAFGGTPIPTLDKTRVYEPGTENGGCHRSDVAEIRSANLAVDERDNISCSGAVTKNIFRAASGGEGQNGEAPQADQLAGIAAAKRVKLIMVSIGGNDLGFASIVQACLTAYVGQQGPCQPSQQAKLDAAKAQVQANIAKAIDEIRAVMSGAGYASGDYRLILQTYPSVAPRASEVRYPESPPVQRAVNGCPFYDTDATWARDSAAPQIGGVVSAAAASRGVEVLDLIDAFQGHEFCSVNTRQSTLGDTPPVQQAEWGRFLAQSALPPAGELQEVFHPNAYGQQAMGTCVGAVFAAAPARRYTCRGAAGVGPSQLQLQLVEAAAQPAAGGGSGSAPTKPTSCLSSRAAVGAKRIGRLVLGEARTRLLGLPSLAGVTRPVVRTTRYRYCVKGDRGGVVAVFGKGAKVELVAATASRYSLRSVRPGVRSSTLKRAYRSYRSVGSGVYRISPRSQRIVGIRKGKVRFVGVASKRMLGSRALVRAYVKRAGL